MQTAQNTPDITVIRAEQTAPITLRKPESEDGAAIWALVKACKPLDQNSMYCNLIQADQFRDTCVLAEMEGEVVGWISGHIRPDDAQILFVWQVAVSEKARGRGLARRMLKEIVSRKSCAGVRRMQTTITRDNDASWALFESFADTADAEIGHEAHFTRHDHFDGQAPTEYMVTIEFEERFRAVA